MLTTACCLVVGLGSGLRLDLVSDWSVVMHVHLFMLLSVVVVSLPASRQCCPALFEFCSLCGRRFCILSALRCRQCRTCIWGRLKYRIRRRSHRSQQKGSGLLFTFCTVLVCALRKIFLDKDFTV